VEFLSEILLELKDVHVYYGSAHILQGVSLYIKEGEVVALLGRNGVGKTTTLRSIMSLTPPKKGSVIFRGKDVTKLPPHLHVRLGLSLCPEGRRIFQGLTVMQNLKVPLSGTNRKELLKLVFQIFPELYERKNQYAGSLSGGEQQMLAIARAIMCNPKLLLLDEPMEGLSLLMVRRVLKCLEEIRERGIGILFTSCTPRDALAISERAYILEKGKIVFEGTKHKLQESSEILQKYLGVV